MNIKVELSIAIEKEIDRLKINQTQAAKLVGTTRPALNRILNGKLDKLGIDKMVHMSHRLGKAVSVKVTKAKAA